MHEDLHRLSLYGIASRFQQESEPNNAVTPYFLDMILRLNDSMNKME